MVGLAGSIEEEQRKVANQCPPSLVEPKEESVDVSPEGIQSAPHLVEPKEEPLPLFHSFPDTKMNYLGDDVCKEEEAFEDEEFPAQFDIDSFGFPPEPAGSCFSTLSKDSTIADHALSRKSRRSEHKTAKVSSNADRVEYITLSSRVVTKPRKYADYLDDSDEDCESPLKRPKKHEKKRRSGSSVSAKVVKRALKIVPKPLEQSEEDCDADSKPTVAKSDSEKKSKKRSCSAPKKSETEMECPECEHRTTSVGAWLKHLRWEHWTTPSLANVVLRCECGHESLSDNHSLVCKLANFTVIRTSDGPIRRVCDEKATPQCVLCEVYPKSVCGYVVHLQNHHKTSLVANGILLKCDCGREIRCKKFGDHNKECSGRQFTIHKVVE